MATSPTYNWPEPDNTDLVKNGALAIRTLGDAIDTTMATMTPKSLVDAKGDLIAASAADTPARLAVGNNGETLVADSSTATGLRYQGNYAAGKNAFINGDFNVWQRGTSFTNPNFTYTADRWAAVTSGTASRSTDAPSGFKYSLALTHTSASYNIALQRIESAETILMNPTVTLSFWAKKTSGTDDLQVSLYYANTADNFGSVTFISQTNITNGSFSTSWTRYNLTTTLSSTALANGLEIRIFTANGSVNGWNLAGAQFESGSVATAFQTATGTIQGELAACQRYYFRSTPATNYGGHGAYGSARTTSAVKAPIPFPVQMRVIPTSVDYSNLAVNDGQNIIAVTGVALSAYESQVVAYPEFTVSGTPLIQYRPYHVNNNNNSAAYLGFSAEL